MRKLAANCILNQATRLIICIPILLTTQPDTNYTVKGTVGGNFKATATQVDSGKTINFKFKWNGKQTADGADAIAPNDLSKITFTLKYKNPTSPVNPSNPTEPGKTIKVVKPVKTGDNTNLLFYLLIAGGSIAGIAGTNIYRRRYYK